MAPVIVARNLYKCYPGFPPVLRGVNIEVQPGEMVAIMGPSGCGKSTMLHILGLLHAPDSGTLDILGQNMLALNSAAVSDFRRENLGFVMQASNLFEHSTVFENVEFPLIYENVPPQERWERVIRALDLVRLSSRVHYRSNRLSGGEQQRVAIARAMVNNPRILLADEPTGALDARTSRVIMENFRSLCHKGGVAMVMVTHDPKMAEYCDSVYTLEDGSLHCKKHEPPDLSVTDAADFLKPPEPFVRGALVAWRFPQVANPGIMQLATRMHGQGLLSRIYTLTGNGVFAGQGGYSLPLPIRHMGFWQRLFGVRIKAPGSGAGELRRELSLAHGLGGTFQRRRALAGGSILADWSQADDIQFLYAAGARRVAAAVCVAAKLLKLPFAFAVRAEDMPLLGADCLVRASDAAFITCATKALAAAFRKFAPNIAPDKVLVLPSPPLYASGEEDADAAMPPQPGKPVELLAMSPSSGKGSFEIVLGAAKILKRKGGKFRLTLLGKASFCLRCRIWAAGLLKQTRFAGSLGDSVAESFRTADIFIGWPLAGKGMDLALPWPLCEAMAFGKPVIALGISAGMDVLEKGRNCLVAHDAASLASQIKTLLDNAAQSAKLGAAAKKDIHASLNVAGATRLLADRMAAAVGQKEQAGQNGL